MKAGVIHKIEMNKILQLILSVALTSCVSAQWGEAEKARPEIDPGEVISDLTTAYTLPISVFIVGSCTHKSQLNKWPELEEVTKLKPSIEFREYVVRNKNPFDVLFEIQSSSINWRVVIQTEENSDKCLYDLTADYQSGKRIISESGEFDIRKIKSGDGEQIVTTAVRLSTNMFSKLIVIEPLFQVRVNTTELEEMINPTIVPSEDVINLDQTDVDKYISEK